MKKMTKKPNYIEGKRHALQVSEEAFFKYALYKNKSVLNGRKLTMREAASELIILGYKKAEELEMDKKFVTPTTHEEPATDISERKAYGTCGHVMLSNEEGKRLREVYGPNLAAAIDILDAYIENGGARAKNYKNHAAVLRKGNWVWMKVQDMLQTENKTIQQGIIQ